MSEMNVELEEGWKAAMKSEFTKPYFHQLVDYLRIEKRTQVIYPPGSLIFSAFNLTPLAKVRVVILGQDPYHGYGQAHGLAFSVPDGMIQPPSLKNIFKELKGDLGIDSPKSGNLSGWAEQGVLLLNTTLTVRQAQPASHANCGWGFFTDEVIRALSFYRAGIVFLLWGKHAQQKESLIDCDKHFILKAAHPSPLSAYNGFFGCKHFSKTNVILNENGLQPINWGLFSL